MANDLIYNPLLKKGFQEVSDTGSIETDVAQLKTNVADLQRHKITKCLIPADLVTLETGEIFQWQGLTQTIDGTELRNGFFYKSNNGKPEVVISAPVNYLIVANGDDVNLNNLDVKAGNYYVLSTANIPNNHVFYYLRPSAESPTPFVQYDFWFLDTLQVGSLVYRISTKEYLTVQKVDTEPALDYELIFTNGLTIRFLGYPGGNTDQLATCINEYNNDFQIISFGYGALNGGYEAVVHYNTSTSAIIDWFIMHFDGDKTYDDVIIPGTLAYTQTDSQPRLKNIANGSGGVINITTDTNIAGDLTVSGTTSTVHAQEIESEADYIELRNGNPLGLANGEKSGLSVNNYDGNNTDCILAVDNQGWARVGDSSGTLQKLATIEETPTDGDFVKYNNSTKELESTMDGSNLTVSFTPDTSAVRANIQSGDTIAQMAKIVNSNFGFKNISNSDFEFTSYITDANLYGCFFSGLGILLICGGFQLITTDIPTQSNIFRFKGYTPISGYPKFIDEYSNNVMNLRTGEIGKGEWWISNYRSSMNSIYWEGLPTVIIVFKTT